MAEKIREKAKVTQMARKAQPLSAFVRKKIEDMVMSGELGGGDWLNENALATELNVSRGPVREATQALAEAGLLIIKRNRGAFVRDISLEDVLHVYDVRAGLARIAGRLAAVRSTSSSLQKLEALWQDMEQARIERAFDRYYEINREFHHAIVDMTGNPRLIDMHDQTEREVFLYLRRGVSGPARIDMSNKQHREILDAIATGDELAAARTFERHVIAGKQRMLDTIVDSTAG